MRDVQILLAVLLVPVLLAALSMWSIGGRGGPDVTRVGAAIVNLDEGADIALPDGTTQFVPFGRQLSAELMEPSDGVQTFHWELMRDDSAQEALTSGAVAAIVTIPQGFSSTLATLGTTGATPAIVSVTSSDATSPLMDEMARLVSDAAARALGQTLGTGVLDQIYLGFDQMKDQLGQAADGAEQLDAGVGQLSGGARQLADGLSSAAGGASELTGGMDQLAGGASQLAWGLAAFRDGFVGTPTSPGLMTGIDLLSAGVNGTPGSPGLAQGTTLLAGGADQLADGIAQLDAGLDPIRNLIPPDFDPSDLPAINVDLVALVAQARELAQATRDLLVNLGPILEDPETAQALIDSLEQLKENCPADQVEYCAEVTRVIDQVIPWISNLPEIASGSIEALDHFLEVTGTPEFAEQLRQVQQAMDQAGGILGQIVGPNGLLNGVRQLAEGSRQLAGAAHQVADGVNGTPSQPGLVQGIAQLSDGARQLQGGLDGTGGQVGLVGGAWALADGLAQARGGVGELAGGLGQLADGGAALADGTTALRSGSSQLAQGLADGVEAIPTYSDAERVRIVSMTMRPVLTESDSPDATTAAIAFPFTAALLVWISAFGSFLMMPGLRRKIVARPVGAMRVVLESLRAPAAVAVASVIGVVVVGALFGVRPVSGSATMLLVIAGAIVAVLSHQAALAVFGQRVGRVACLLFLTLQTVALMGILPFQDAPETLRAVNSLFPLGELASALQVTVLGVGGSWIPQLLALIVWGIVAFTASVVAVSQNRSMDADRLRRDLNVPVEVTSTEPVGVRA